MKAEPADIKKWTEAIENLEKMSLRRKAQISSKSEPLFYDLYAKYFKNFRTAVAEGKDIAAFYTCIPAEILYAMDMFPAFVQASCIGMTPFLANYGDCLDISREFGIAQETCSAHRLVTSHFIKGWFPSLKVFVGGDYACDARASSRVVSELYDCPAFYLDIPYYQNQEDTAYFIQELEDLISFLEEQTKRKMDWDRLQEIAGFSAEMTRLQREIFELRKAVPAVMESRFTWQMFFLNWLYAGTPDGVLYMKTLRDEIKERVDQKKGVVPGERFRLLDLFLPPLFALDQILNWLEKEKGAVIVCETLAAPWREWNGEMDPSRPLEILVCKLYNGPFGANTLYGPGEPYLRNVVKYAEEYKADAAIWWNQNSCRQAGRLRGLKDVLREEAGIPTCVVEVDLIDPSFVTPENILEQLEIFFEMLEDHQMAKRGIV